MAVKVDLRLMLGRTYVAAKNSGVGFNVASIPAGFSAPSRGAFDPQYMTALYGAGFDQGKSAKPFGTEPPPFSGQPSGEASDPRPDNNLPSNDADKTQQK